MAVKQGLSPLSYERIRWSQTKREPMLLFEFEAALFQFEQREPQLAPLSQLPPKMTASFPSLPYAFMSLDPGIEHGADFGHECLRRLQLFLAQHPVLEHKAQPSTQDRQPAICVINLADLIRFTRDIKQLGLI